MSKHESVTQQIDRLVTFIAENVPGEPSQSQGAVDTAIRLLESTLGQMAGRLGDPAALIRQAKADAWSEGAARSARYPNQRGPVCERRPQPAAREPVPNGDPMTDPINPDHYRRFPVEVYTSDLHGGDFRREADDATVADLVAAGRKVFTTRKGGSDE